MRDWQSQAHVKHILKITAVPARLVMIVKVFITQGQSLRSLAQQAHCTVFDTGLTARIIQYARDRIITQSQCAISLSQQQYTTVGGNVATLKIDLNNTLFTGRKFK